jgi:hypothetical protein
MSAFSRLLVLIVLLSAAPAHADGSQVCDRIFQRLERAESELSPIGKVADWLWPRERPEAPAEPERRGPSTAAEYWVTIQTGTAGGPDCEQGLVRSIYYLPGLVVRPVLELAHDDLVVLTEHGLYAILPLQHLAPITSDTHYIFSESLASQRLCVNSARLNPDCDPLLPFANSRARLHAIFSYIRGENPSELDKRRRIYLRSLHNRQLPDREDERAMLCDRFNAGSLYARERTTDPMPGIDQEPGYQLVSMSLCAYEAEEPTDTLQARAGMKIVTLEGAKESFSVTLPTLYLRRSDQLLDLSKLVEGQSPFRTRKECSEELSISQFQTFGLSGGFSSYSRKLVTA